MKEAAFKQKIKISNFHLSTFSFRIFNLFLLTLRTQHLKKKRGMTSKQESHVSSQNVTMLDIFAAKRHQCFHLKSQKKKLFRVTHDTIHERDSCTTCLKGFKRFVRNCSYLSFFKRETLDSVPHFRFK